MAPQKAVFAPLPTRAIGDKRLTATHFHILGAIAAHDRMSGPRDKGAGCYASNKTLADRANVNYANFSTAVNELGRWGYIEAAPHPLNKRTRVYRVIYDDLPTGKVSTSDCLPTGKASDHGTPSHDHLPIGERTAEMVCPPNEQALETTELPDDNIFRETERYYAKRESYSPEGASLRSMGSGSNGASFNAGAFLAITERKLRLGVALEPETQQQIETILESTGMDDPVHQHANRLLDEFGKHPS